MLSGLDKLFQQDWKAISIQSSHYC